MGFDFSALDYDKPTAWVEVPNGDGAKVLLAYTATDEIANALRKVTRRRSMIMSESDLDIDSTCEWLADHVLISWSGFFHDGEAIEPTRENKFKYLKKYLQFRLWVQQEASRVENFKDETQDLKNSKSGAKGR